MQFPIEDGTIIMVKTNSKVARKYYAQSWQVTHFLEKALSTNDTIQ